MRRWAMGWLAAGAWLVFACGSSQHSPGGATAGGSAVSASGTAGSDTAGGSAAGGSAAGGASSAAPIALQDLCPVFTHDLCVYLMQCGGARYRDADHCERELSCFGLPELTAAAASGAVDYDPQQVGACHERFLQSPCTFGFFLFSPNIYDVLAYCPGTLTPKLTAGAACSADGECSQGLYCNKGESFLCPGQCQAFARAGEPCSDSARCATGNTCQNKVCTSESKPGDSCSTTPCEYSVSCPEDQVCPGNVWCDKAANQCTSGRLEGEPCGTIGSGTTQSQADCAVNLWCDNVGLDSAGTCRKPSDAGGACGFGFSGCSKGLHCVGYVPFGASASLGKCQTAGPAGSDCASVKDCDMGLTCVSSKCQAPGAALAACNNDDDDCQAGLVCVSGKCAEARYPGDPCDAGRCTYSRCINGTCDYHAKVGEACATPDDCATGACVKGLCYDDSICKTPPP